MFPLQVQITKSVTISHLSETIHKRRVTPNVEPGYLKSYLPDAAPLKAESWDTIMDDFEKFIMPGVTHWQHPRFHAYFPAGNSYPSILADMIADGIGCVGFSWVRQLNGQRREILTLALRRQVPHVRNWRSSCLIGWAEWLVFLSSFSAFPITIARVAE